MVLSKVWGAVLLAGVAVAQTYPPDVVDELAKESLPKLKEWLEKNPQGECTLETAVRRREWFALIYRSSFP